MDFSKYLLFILFLSCNSAFDNKTAIFNSGETQGTSYNIKYIGPHGIDYKDQIDSLLQEVDNSLSTYKNQSLISRINYNQQKKTDSLFRTVFRSAKEIFNQTGGLFDCSVAPLVNAWGFGFSQKEQMDSSRVNEILEIVGFDKVYLQNDMILKPKRMLLDFNSIAQGFTVDLISKMLEQKKIKNYLVEVGGEIKSRGKNIQNKVWTVGVDKPIEQINYDDRFQFVIELDNKSLATSGNYRKYIIEDGIKYSHVINPITGFPAKNNLLSVTVIHNDCMIADAYATAFMVMGLEKSKKFLKDNKDLEAYLVFSADGEALNTYVTENFEKSIVKY
tara:strand:- start:977 stop:1972 length:996 start_codon:yes stop_codon:yes gene_type:complete